MSNFKDEVNKLASERLELDLRRGLARLTSHLPADERRDAQTRMCSAWTIPHFYIKGLVVQVSKSGFTESEVITPEKFEQAHAALLKHLGKEATKEVSNG